MTERRRPRLLWANVYCLLDTSSGASMSVGQMLLQLQLAGWDVFVLGATVFDHARGTAGLLGRWPEVKRRRGELMVVESEGLAHRLFVTANTNRGEMTNREQSQWFTLYVQALKEDQPDVVFYYGGQPFDHLIASEARDRGIGVAFYLVNGNYHKKHWCKHVDLVLTDSRATADLYKERLDLDVTVVGAFIDPLRVVASEQSRERLLFVNPVPEKGAAWVACLALLLERRRPDIIFEVAESRGKWSETLAHVAKASGRPQNSLENVVVTPNTRDMRPVYGRARALLAPSLCWESGARVLAEAMLNGIPAIATERGGSPEMIQKGGILLRLPEKYYESPYALLPPEAEVAQLAKLVESLYDDQARYESLVEGAYAVGQHVHGLEASTHRLVNALMGLVEDRSRAANHGHEIEA